MFAQTITKDQIHEMPPKQFEGEIIVIETFKTLKSVCQILKTEAILGFDTESKPTFKKGQISKVALLQLSTGSTAYLFRLNRIGLPPHLIEILTDSNILKIGAAIHDDLKSLKKLHHFVPANFVDLQQYAKQFNIENIGLRDLTANVLKIRISKAQQLTNWESEKLTQPQLVYAATDAWVCYEIYKTLLAAEI